MTRFVCITNIAFCTLCPINVTTPETYNTRKKQLHKQAVLSKQRTEYLETNNHTRETFSQNFKLIAIAPSDPSPEMHPFTIPMIFLKTLRKPK